jgi:hypothetical protein
MELDNKLVSNNEEVRLTTTTSIEEEIGKVNAFIKERRHTLITEPDGRIFALMEDYYHKLIKSPISSTQHSFKSTRS